jgi:hypothetical protein
MHALLLDPGGVLSARHCAFRTAAFRPLETVGVFLHTAVRILLLSTTITHFGAQSHSLRPRYTRLRTPPCRDARGSLLPCWRGFCQVGLEPFPVRTHWATTTNFMGLLPLLRFWTYLGATSAWFGWCPSACVATCEQLYNGVRYCHGVYQHMKWTARSRGTAVNVCATMAAYCCQQGAAPPSASDNVGTNISRPRAQFLCHEGSGERTH